MLSYKEWDYEMLARHGSIIVNQSNRVDAEPCSEFETDLASPQNNEFRLSW